MDARAFPGGTGGAIGKPRPRLAHPESFIFRAGRWGVVLFTSGILPSAPSGPASPFALLLQRSAYFLLDKQEKVGRPPLRRSKPPRQR